MVIKQAPLEVIISKIEEPKTYMVNVNKTDEIWHCMKSIERCILPLELNNNAKPCTEILLSATDNGQHEENIDDIHRGYENIKNSFSKVILIPVSAP